MSLDYHNPRLSDTSTQTPISRRAKLIWSACGIAVVILLAVIITWRLHTTKAPVGRFGAAGPIAVGVGQVTTADVPITIDALGAVTPLATVTVHPQVTGPLTKISFTEGQIVKAGDVLAEIDSRPFQAAVDQAQAQLERDQSLLDNARVDLDRYKKLMDQNSVSEQQYATQKALVDQDVATVASDKANLESNKLNLSYCYIRSPVPGRVGLRQVDIGNLVQASSSTIVIVTQLQPISVLFTVPEDSVNQIVKRIGQNEKLPVDAFDRTFTTKLTSGTLSNIDNEIDPTTGTLKLRAMFDNKSNELFPSQFVNVRLLLNTLTQQVVAPASAIMNGSSGNYVYLYNAADSTVSVRNVTVGPNAGTMVAIRSGLQPGETVVVDGADQLRDGAHVTLPGAAGAATRAPGQQRNGNWQGGQRQGQGQNGGRQKRKEGAPGGGGPPGGGGGGPPGGF